LTEEERRFKAEDVGLTGSFSQRQLAILDPPASAPPSEITPVSIYEYYLTCCSLTGVAPIDKLVDQLKERSDFPTSLDLSETDITKENAGPVIDLLRLDYGVTEINMAKCDLADEVIQGVPWLLQN
jgi:hypothetical protein